MNSNQAVIGYFKFKKIENMGFLKYGYYKRIIQYVIDYYNEYYVRKIFLQLLDKGYFIRIKNHKNSYKYQFNPTPKKKITEDDLKPQLPITLHWN
jgi:hypothetical protein